ncbi:MAG: hypothetical protein WCV79_02530 [Candidatus Paceibacterota bacterium]|jgi:hypothetical protein
MTPEEKSLLERTYKLVEENNAMLRSVRRSSRITMILRGAYWLVIIGASIGAYYLIQPYIDFMLGLIKGGSGADIQSSASLFQDLLK